MSKSTKKKGRRFIALFLAAVTVLADFPGFPGRAEAGNPGEIAALIAAITALEMTLLATEYAYLGALKDQAEDEIARVTSQAAYYNFIVQRDKRLEQEYQDDHAMLSKDIVWTDRTLEIQSLYSQLAQADAQSFADPFDTAKFRKLNPGYPLSADQAVSGDQTSGDVYIHFAQRYKDRVTEWGTYAKGVIDANLSEARSVILFQPQLVGITGLKNASVSADHYLALLQAGNQTYNMSGQLVERLRIDVNRQTEARTRFALDERQEKSDERAAFNQAVKWKNQTQGRRY
jgi:hypothetical protein